MAKFCNKMIIQDSDGMPILDFLGERAREAGVNTIDAELVKSARDFVASQYKKHLDEDNYKLSSWYFRLLSYFNARAKLWSGD